MTIIDPEPISKPEKTPATAKWLGWAGVIPFAVSALGIFFLAGDPFWLGLSTSALIGYGGIILSFLGGVRWGTALGRRRGNDRNLEFFGSVSVSVLAWICLLIPNPVTSLMLLALGFIVQGFIDYRAAVGEWLPAWYGHLRVMLTIAACTSLLFGMISLF